MNLRSALGSLQLPVAGVGALCTVGFSLGLAIPPGNGYGITFRRGQRLLFVVGAAATVAALFVPILAFGVVFAAAMDANLLPFYAWLGCHALAVLSVGAGLGWRGYEAVAPVVARRVNG